LWNHLVVVVDLSVRFSAQVIASSAILLAARDWNMTLPHTPRPWCHLRRHLLTNQMTESGEKDRSGWQQEKDAVVDWAVASYGLVKSLVVRIEDHETGFNDPDSFLWEYQKELFEKEIAKDDHH
jgi:hypothetical protein